MFIVKSTRLFALLLLMSAVFLNSCKKEEEISVQSFSYIRFINTSPGLGTYNIYANDKMANTAAIPFGGGVSYKAFEPGTHSIKFTTASNITSLLTKDVTLKANEVSSFYLIGKPGQLDGLLVFDDVQSASLSDKSFIRFINLSSDAPALDLNIVGGTSVTTGKGYKTFSAYTKVDPKKYSFEIKDSATGIVKATLTDVDFVVGRYYTIIAQGLLSPGTNEQPFSVQSIINQ